jgi:hypothetical protein
MQITSVRYRELVSLRGGEHNLAAVCAFEKELTDLLPRLMLNLIVRTALRSRCISS